MASRMRRPTLALTRTWLQDEDEEDEEDEEDKAFISKTIIVIPKQGPSLMVRVRARANARVRASARVSARVWGIHKKSWHALAPRAAGI